MGLSLLLFLFADPISRALFNDNLAVALILPVSILFAANILVFLISSGRYRKPGFYNFFYLLQTHLMVVLTATLVVNGFGVLGAVVGFLIGQLIIFVMMLGIIIKSIGFILPRFINLREYLHFTVPIVPTHISTWILDASDRYVIGFLIGLKPLDFTREGTQWVV